MGIAAEFGSLQVVTARAQVVALGLARSEKRAAALRKTAEQSAWGERWRERFYARCQYEPETGCLFWTGTSSDAEYGIATVRRQRLLAHRVAYFLAWGDPGPSNLLHRCGNPRCVGPLHLRPGSQTENMADAARHGRRVGSRGRLTLAQRAALVADRQAGMTIREAAEKYGTTPPTVIRWTNRVRRQPGSPAAGDIRSMMQHSAYVATGGKPAKSQRERYLERLAWDRSDRERRAIKDAPSRIDPDKALPVLEGALGLLLESGPSDDEGRGLEEAAREARFVGHLLPTDEQHALALLAWLRRRRPPVRTRRHVLRLLRDAISLCGGKPARRGGWVVTMGPGRGVCR